MLHSYNKDELKVVHDCSYELDLNYYSPLDAIGSQSPDRYVNVQ